MFLRFQNPSYITVLMLQINYAQSTCKNDVKWLYAKCPDSNFFKLALIKKACLEYQKTNIFCGSQMYATSVTFIRIINELFKLRMTSSTMAGSDNWLILTRQYHAKSDHVTE